MPMQRELYPQDWSLIDTHKRTLTVAHLDHNPANCDPSNLKALCAPCHLRYDAKHHAETRRIKRLEGKA